MQPRFPPEEIGREARAASLGSILPWVTKKATGERVMGSSLKKEWRSRTLAVRTY